jgi:hypothetical protein
MRAIVAWREKSDTLTGMETMFAGMQIYLGGGDRFWILDWILGGILVVSSLLGIWWHHKNDNR